MKFEQIPQNEAAPETPEKKKPSMVESLKAKATRAVQLGALLGALSSSEIGEAQTKGGEALQKASAQTAEKAAWNRIEARPEGMSVYVEDLKAVPKEAVFLGKAPKREVYKMARSGERDLYITKHASGRIYSFTASSDAYALSEAADLSPTASELKTLENVRKTEQSLKDKGYIKKE